MNFRSDNVTGAAPEILEAVTRAAAGTANSYGDDPLTQKVERRLQEIFETGLRAFPVATGTAANALALATLVPPYGAVYCHASSHVNVDECGAPEAFTGGAKLVTFQGAGAKLRPDDLAATLAHPIKGIVHHVQPAAISITQATEAGTVYTAGEVTALAEIARRHGLPVHMDGARFANALAFLGCSPAELTWRAGVDVLSLGATKNGALGAEAVVFFRPELAADFEFRRKRAGHLFSKMRFLSAQLDAYLTDGLWLRLAAHANMMARRLGDGLAALPGVKLQEPVEANEVFASLPDRMVDGLTAKGFGFARWDAETVRFVTAFNTEPAAVDGLVAAARTLAAGPMRKTA